MIVREHDVDRMFGAERQRGLRRRDGQHAKSPARQQFAQSVERRGIVIDAQDPRRSDASSAAADRVFGEFAETRRGARAGAWHANAEDAAAPGVDSSVSVLSRIAAMRSQIDKPSPRPFSPHGEG